MKHLLRAAAPLCLVAIAAPAAAEQIEIVGSSTVYPFTTVAAERFSQVSGAATPKVESTGTGGGMKLLCAGAGAGHPDIANASRAIKSSEIELCASNGLAEPVEVKIGYDGIVVAHSSANPDLSLSRTELFRALARSLPAADGSLQPNPHANWDDIRADLPAKPIRVYGPPPTSGTRDAFVELAMEEGCEGVDHIDQVAKEDHDVACTAIREDGAFIEAGENDNLIIQRLVANPDTLGIFGYSFLEENSDMVKGIAVDGVVPSFEAIEAEQYPLARPLFIYVKSEHVAAKPSLRDFVEFYLSDGSLGEDGFLLDRGLVPLPAAELDAVRAAVSTRLQ